MDINAKLLYMLINDRYPVERICGTSHHPALSLPMFLDNKRLPETGRIYILRTQYLPRTSKTDCIYLCVGSRPLPQTSGWKGEVWYILDREADLFSLFNAIIEVLDRIRSWSDRLYTLEKQQGDLEEFVKCGISLFGNPVTITDYNLRILCNCEIVENQGEKQIILSRQFSQVPGEISMEFQDEFKERIRIKTPYYYKGQRLNPEGYNYCVNLYLGDNYIGTCTLWDAMHPIRESDEFLFQEFAAHIQRILCMQTEAYADQLVTMKSIFSDLLHSYPVSEENLRWALDLLFKNMELSGNSIGYWVCLVIQSANRRKTLPKEYLCNTLENMLPLTTVLDYEEDIVCYCVIPEGEDCESTVLDILLPYLKDMNFRVGVSSAFIDLFRSRDYYLQARAILKTGYKKQPKEFIYCFEDYILSYLLEHCLGEFDYSMVETMQIQELKNMGSTVDYWDTLKHYLDNECNASKTAQELYLHRSSLLPRLEKIRSMVDLDTPEQRLYLRLCMYLTEK